MCVLLPRYTPENQKRIENLILLLLGTSKEGRLSVLHIEKELFLLQEAASDFLTDLYYFIDHYRGPYSKEIYDAIITPMFLESCWRYESSHDNLSGGFAQLNVDGKKEFQRITKKIYSEENEKVIQLLAAMDILHDLYDGLTPRELLYIVYTSKEYKRYIKKSIVYDQVVNDRTRESLKKKMLIDKSATKKG